MNPFFGSLFLVSLNPTKVVELRAALEERGLDTSGLKADLMQRLQVIKPYMYVLDA